MVFFRLFAGEAPLDADAAPPGPPACFLHVRDAGVAARPPSAFMVQEWPNVQLEYVLKAMGGRTAELSDELLYYLGTS